MKYGSNPRLTDAFQQDSDTSPLNEKPSSLSTHLLAKKHPHTTKPQLSPKHLKLPASLTVTQLAEISGLKRFQIIARLMELSIFANVDYVMDFTTAEKALSVFNLTAEIQKE